MALTHLEALAQQGDISATAELVEEWLQMKQSQITVKAKQDSLQIALIARPTPQQAQVVPLLTQKLCSLHPQGYQTLKICGKEQAEDFPDWYVEIPLDTRQPVPVDAVLDTVAITAGKAMGTATAAGQVAVGIGKSVGKVAHQASKAFAHQAIDLGDQMGKTALEANKKIGSTFAWVDKNPLTRQVSKILPFNWLFVVDRVDLTKAVSEVENLQRQHPRETASEIAHRLIVNKATLAAGTGLVSSLVPGFALALFAIDLAATMSLQAELVYQIAAAYGFDLHDETRKGEALAVLGLALGGGQAMKVGGSFATRAGFVGILRNIPMAGAVIGLGTNAVMTYSLGYAACRFYEAKQQSLSTESALSVSRTASQEYMETALAQEIIMDRILVHVALADHPYRPKSEILRELDAILSPASVEAIATSIDNPPPLEDLLNQLHRDYALPLLVKCYKVAQIDGEIQPEAANVIDQITQRFKIDLDDLNQFSGEALYAQG